MSEKKNINSVCPEHSPLPCNCYSSMNGYGTGYKPIPWPKNNNSVTDLFENFDSAPSSSCSCYSNQTNYGMKFAYDYDKNWRCPTPTGCVRRRTQAFEGVL